MPTLRKSTQRKSTKQRATNKGKSWTKSQVQALRKSARQLPTTQIAKKLGRTVTAIRSKAHSVGISLGQKAKKATKRRR